MSKGWADLATLTQRSAPPTNGHHHDIPTLADALAERAVAVSGREALDIPSVFACVRVIAHTVEQLPLVHTVGGQPRPLPQWLRVPERVTTFTTGQLLELWSIDMALHGAAFAWIDRRDGELVVEPVDPSAVDVHTTRDHGVIRRSYTVDGQPAPMAGWDSSLQQPRRGLLHMPYLTASHDPAGMGPLRRRQALTGYLTVERFAAQVFDAGTWSGGRLETDQDISPAVAERYQQRWIENRKLGKMPVLGSGLRYVNDVISPKDAQWIESRTFNAQEIARMFGVPMRYLGLPSGDATTYATARDNDAYYLRSCISSYTSSIAGGLSRVVGPGTGETNAGRISFDYSAWLAVVSQLETNPTPAPLPEQP